MPSTGFEPISSAVEGPQTYASDHAATGTSVYNIVNFNNLIRHDLIPSSAFTLLE